MATAGLTGGAQCSAAFAHKDNPKGGATCIFYNISCLAVAIDKGLVGGPSVGFSDLAQRHLIKQDAFVGSSDLTQRQRQQQTAHIAAELFESV